MDPISDAPTKTQRKKKVRVIRNSLSAYRSDPDGPIAMGSLYTAEARLRELIDMQLAAQREGVASTREP